jgi:prepilin-type N-terminal cleavage/methylation domain-containing protein
MGNQGLRDRSRVAPAAGGCGRVRRRGFTLVELLVVIVIISIIISFVMLAASDAAHRAEERATQALISKLETGLNERIDALMQSRPDVNWAHAYMAAVWNSGFPNANFALGTRLKSGDRAQVFSWYDYLKRELPDVFVLQPDGNYPINFGFPSGGYPGLPNPLLSPSGAETNFILPLGNSVINNPGGGSFGDADPNNFLSQTTPSLGVTGSGIYGASYANAAGLFKNLPGISQFGWDAVDNNANNLIDEIGEGNWNLQLFKANHTHVTARAEVLYAILVEGIGPWGSVFSRDDFNDREVKDTDGDGLPEFVDAWGQPLQFFRWPVFYHSELQRGQVMFPDVNGLNTWDLVPPYMLSNIPSANADIGAVFQERERDPLDPNQQLTAPQWWALNGVGGQLAANNASPFNGMSQAGALGASGGAQAFELFFHRLTEPIPPGAGALFWDRGGIYPRRSYYTKFLILSGGRDKQPGVFLYADSDLTVLGQNAATCVIANENCALPFAMDVLGGNLMGFAGTATFPSPMPQYSNISSFDPNHPTSYDLREAAKDDISNHNLQAVSAIGGSG